MLEKMLDDVSENFIYLEDNSSDQEDFSDDSSEDVSSDQEDLPEERSEDSYSDQEDLPEERSEDSYSDQEDLPEEMSEDNSSNQEDASPENNYFYFYSTSENTVSGNFVTIDQLAVFDTTLIFLLACVLGALVFNAFMKKL